MFKVIQVAPSQKLVLTIDSKTVQTTAKAIRSGKSDVAKVALESLEFNRTKRIQENASQVSGIYLKYAGKLVQLNMVTI